MEPAATNPPLDRGEIGGMVPTSESSPFLGEDLEFFFFEPCSGTHSLAKDAFFLPKSEDFKIFSKSKTA